MKARAKRPLVTVRPSGGRFLQRIVAACAACISAASSGEPVGAAGARLFKSGPIQITADGRWVWAANQDNDSVSRIDTGDLAVLEVPLPDPEVRHAPRGLSVREDGTEVWVACHDSDRLYVLAGGDGSVLARIDLPWGSGPHSVALSRDQSRALVTLHRAEALAVVDTASRTVTHLLRPVYRSPFGIAWTEDGGNAWVTHLFAPGEHPFLTRVDFSGAEPKVQTRIQLFAADPRQSSKLAAPFDVAEGGYLTTRGHPAQIPSVVGRRELWLPIQYNNISEDRFSPDSTVQSTIRRLDIDSRKLLNGNDEKVILTAVHVHQPTSSGAYVGPGWNAGVAGPIDIAFSADGRTTYLLHELSNDLVVLPSDTGNVRPAGAPPLPEIAAGDRPMGIAVSPVAEVAYVYNLLSRDVSVIDLDALAEVARIPVVPVTGEPLAPAVLTGAKLFHTSADPRVSSNGKVACASCHINAEHDGRTWAFHRLPGSHGPREVPSLLGLRLTMGPRDPATGFGQLHRSGDRDEIQDFEHTFQGVTMGGTGFLGAAVQPELGPPNAGRDPDLDAIAEYLLSLDPISRSPYREPGGALSEAAVRGATFFVGSDRARKPADAGCASCHVPETGFTDFAFHDVGQRRDSNENELGSRVPAWHVNTPTLVGVWTTPPYNGVSRFAETILEVIEDQAARAESANPHGTPDGLTPRQRRDLAEFVLSIDGNMTAAEVRNARDRTPPRIERVEPASSRRIVVWFNETVQRESAEDPSNWRLEELDGTPVPITAAERGPSGDRVDLWASLRVETTYRLRPTASILDAADSASGGTANAIDPEDPLNTRVFTLGRTLTITLGPSEYNTLVVPVHDTAMVGPGLSTWSHDSIWLFPVNSGPGVNTGFLRFDWRDTFVEETGVVSADRILDVRFSLLPVFGEAQRVELRRCLRPWSDPAAGGDWNRNATGAPTWRDHAHPSWRWAGPGAGRLGGTGADPADYSGDFDLAARVDAVVSMPSVNERVEFSGALVTQAFRFWFEHPALDYGYALRLAAGSTQETRFERAEEAGGDEGPFLVVTYDLAGTEAPVREVLIRPGDPWRYFEGTEAPPAGWNEVDFDDAAWPEGATGIGYGDGDDVTVLEAMRNGYLAFFARRRFEIADPGAVLRLALEVSVDDGIVVYLNGVEVGRYNMPEGPVDHRTPASVTVGNAPEEPPVTFDLPAALLRAGTNVSAASIHNASLESSDASFVPTLTLLRRGGVGPGAGPRFLRGDCNGDGVAADVSDAVFLLLFNFARGSVPPCLAACDANGDGDVTGAVSDAVYLLFFSFLGGPPPAAPFPACGTSSFEADAALGCENAPQRCAVP